MKSLRLALLAAVLVAGITGSPAVAEACPMCKVAQEDSTDPGIQARPRAYMYSILFMLSMPATILGAFGVAFFRLSRQQQLINQANGFFDGTQPVDEA
jgi:hypothetical protein